MGVFVHRSGNGGLVGKQTVSCHELSIFFWS